MAEIRVEPRSKAPIWPWIIGILILLGLIWLLVEAFDRDDEYLEERDERIEEVGVEDDAVGSLPAHVSHALLLASWDRSGTATPEAA